MSRSCESMAFQALKRGGTLPSCCQPRQRVTMLRSAASLGTIRYATGLLSNSSSSRSSAPRNSRPGTRRTASVNCITPPVNSNTSRRSGASASGLARNCRIGVEASSCAASPASFRPAGVPACAAGSSLRGGGTFPPFFLGISGAASRRSRGCFGGLAIVLRFYARFPETKFLGEEAL